MYQVYLDVGTTRLRLYLLKDFEVVYYKRTKVGARDTSINGYNKLLKSELHLIYQKMLDEYKLEPWQIQKVYASGMLACAPPLGLVKADHLVTPVSLFDLYNNMMSVDAGIILRQQVNIIRGIKTINNNLKITVHNAHKMNNMRGEELEVFGVLASLDKDLSLRNLAIVLPGSHTQIVYCQNGVILDILSFFSGELFHALASSTILSKTMTEDPIDLDITSFRKGIENNLTYGFNRAIYLGNTLQIFNDTDIISMNSYIVGVIFSGIGKCFATHLKKTWIKIDQIIIAGESHINQIYQEMISELCPGIPYTSLDINTEKPLTVKGLIHLLSLGN